MTAEHPIERISASFALKPPLAGALPTRISAGLRRGAPERWSRHLGELMPVLVTTGLRPEGMDADRTARWAVLVHLVAVLSGTGHDRAHGAKRCGAALLETGYSEARLSKLLTARGDALRGQVARLARFLRTKGAIPLDLRPLADLVLHEGQDAARADRARLDIAQSYYAAADRASRETAE